MADFTLAARLGEIGGSPAGAIGGTPYANAPIAPWLTPATTILVAPPVVSGGADTMSPGRAPANHPQSRPCRCRATGESAHTCKADPAASPATSSAGRGSDRRTCRTGDAPN